MINEGKDYLMESLKDHIKSNKDRRKELLSLIMPLLSPQTKREIIENGKNCYIASKQKVPDDKYLLKYLLENHLEMTILDFDQNIHYLDESQIQAFAKILNEKPMTSFFIGD